LCLAIAKKPGGVITKEWLKNGQSSNSDGSGFAFVNKDGNIIIRKFLNGFRKFYKNLRAAEAENPESPFLIHFRLATHGARDKNNCHPFFLSSDGVSAAAVHNGVINVPIPKGSNDSDTAFFLREIVTPNMKEILFTPFIKEAFERRLSYNKVVFLTNNKEIIFLNEKSGHWDDENLVWYSNSSYMHACKISSSWMGHGSWISDYYDEKYGTGKYESTADSVETKRWDNKRDYLLGEGDLSSYFKCQFCDLSITEEEAFEITDDNNQERYIICSDCDDLWRDVQGTRSTPITSESQLSPSEVDALMKEAGIYIHT